MGGCSDYIGWDGQVHPVIEREESSDGAIDTGEIHRRDQLASDKSEMLRMKKIMLEVADELCPSGAWMEEGQRTRLAQRLRDAVRT